MPDGANQMETRFIIEDLPEDESKFAKKPVKGIPIAVPTDAHTLNQIPNQDVEYVNGSVDSEEEEAKPVEEIGRTGNRQRQDMAVDDLDITNENDQPPSAGFRGNPRPSNYRNRNRNRRN
jgi:hypothetical protein